jgi:hypothetical protein
LGTVLANYHDGRILQRVAGVAAAAGHQWPAAQKHFQAALRQADQFPHRLEQLHTRRWYAWTLLERGEPGDHDHAARLLAEAVAGYHQLQMPRHQEIAELLAARAWRELDEKSGLHTEAGVHNGADASGPKE